LSEHSGTDPWLIAEYRLIQEETELKAFVDTKSSLEKTAGKFQKLPGSVIVIRQRLGFQLKVNDYVCSIRPLPRELPGIEETI
jgi:hypothetical protein